MHVGWMALRSKGHLGGGGGGGGGGGVSSVPTKGELYDESNRKPYPALFPQITH